MDPDWFACEIALSQKHEELLMRRQALLQGTERYYDAQSQHAASFVSDLQRARDRNLALATDVERCLAELREDVDKPGTPKFNTLKNNYWMMVKNVFPLWYEEVKEYDTRPQRSRSPNGGSRSPRVSPRLRRVSGHSGSNVRSRRLQASTRAGSSS